MADIDPGTLQWRESFDEKFKTESQYTRKVLDEIHDLVKQQNQRVRAVEIELTKKAGIVDVQTNSIAIASLKTWVAIVGGGVGIIGLGTALLQAVR